MVRDKSSRRDPPIIKDQQNLSSIESTSNVENSFIVKRVKKLERLHARSENRNGGNTQKKMAAIGDAQLSTCPRRKEQHPFASNGNSFDGHRITSSLSKITKKHEGKASQRRLILE